MPGHALNDLCRGAVTPVALLVEYHGIPLVWCHWTIHGTLRWKQRGRQQQQQQQIIDVAVTSHSFKCPQHPEFASETVQKLGPGRATSVRISWESGDHSILPCDGKRAVQMANGQSSVLNSACFGLHRSHGGIMRNWYHSQSHDKCSERMACLQKLEEGSTSTSEGVARQTQAYNIFHLQKISGPWNQVVGGKTSPYVLSTLSMQMKTCELRKTALRLFGWLWVTTVTMQAASSTWDMIEAPDAWLLQFLIKLFPIKSKMIKKQHSLFNHLILDGPMPAEVSTSHVPWFGVGSLVPGTSGCSVVMSLSIA